MTVYVITSGEYSDYSICAVALDKEKAEILKEKFDRYDYTGARIEEYDTEDYEAILSGKSVYGVSFDKCGNCINIYNENEDLSPYLIDRVKYSPSFNEFTGVCVVYVMTDSPEAAVKIAAERRAKYLAEKMGL